MTAFLLSDIYIYPVKSLAGIRVASWQVTTTGLRYDRNWMLVDSTGQFLSQRRLPKMTLIRTRLTADRLILSASGCSDLALPLSPPQNGTITGTVWHDQLELWAVSPEADTWFSKFLGVECRLTYQPDSVVRQVNQTYARLEDRTSLSDGFPFLLIAESSLDALNHAMQLDFPMTRFRPNLVVSGCSAYEEDYWREISIGEIDFRLPKPCSRCSVPTIDPETAQTGTEPLTTLSRLRRWQNKVYFGQNAIHDQCGVLSVGDPITVRRTGEKQPPV